MAISTKKISLPKAAEDIGLKTVGDQLIALYRNKDGEMIQKILPGNLNKEETEIIKVGEKQFKVSNGKVTEVSGNLSKKGKTKSKANPGDAGESIVKLAKGGDPSEFGMLSVKAGVDNNPKPTQADRIVGATKKMKKGGIVKKKSSRTRIAKRGFGIAKRGY